MNTEVNKNVNLTQNPTIQRLAETPDHLTQLCSPIEQAVIKTCKEIVGNHGGGRR